MQPALRDPSRPPGFVPAGTSQEVHRSPPRIRAGGLTFILAICLFADAPTLPAAASGRVVRVGVFSAAPMVQVEKGRPSGLFVDLVEYFSRALEWKVEYVPGLWSEQLVRLERGEIDLLPAVGFTRERTAKYDFSRQPVFIDSGVLYTGRRVVLNTIFDLQGKRVAALEGSIFTTGFARYMESFGIRCEIVNLRDNREVMEAIADGRAEAGVCIYSLGTVLARRYPVEITTISFSPVALKFAVKRGLNADLVEGIDRLMTAMSGDLESVYARALQRWTRPPSETSVPRWIWWSLAGLLLSGLMLAAGIVVLRRQVNLKTRRLTAEAAAREKAVEALDAERERLSVTLQSIADGVITTDPDCRIVMINRAAASLTGVPASEATNRLLADVFLILDADTGDPCEDPVRKVVQTGSVVETDLARLVARDDRKLEVAYRAAPIRDAQGSTAGVVLVIRDMTEVRRAQEADERTARLHSLGILAGGIAHDFNNMLAIIFGNIELARSLTRDEEVRRCLDGSSRTITRAKGLALQLLTFAKGGSPISRPGFLSPVIRKTVEFSLSGSTVTARFDLPDGLRPCRFDPGQIGQVVENLVINAVQAMPGGGTIHVSAENFTVRNRGKAIVADGDYVRVRIRDEGIGVPGEILSHIFDPYYTTKQTGSGLGLAVAYSILQRHGGGIEADSVPGQGSVFSFYLPVSEESPAPEASLSGSGHRGMGRILVMDDEEALLSLLDRQLQTLGYTVSSARDASEAMKLFTAAKRAGEPYSAVLLDLTIPGGPGGLEAVREIRKSDSQIPVFVMSGYSEDPVLSDPGRSGFNASLSKPFAFSELGSLLSRFVKARGD